MKARTTYQELRKDRGWGLLVDVGTVAGLFGYTDRVKAFRDSVNRAKSPVFQELRKIRVPVGRKMMFTTSGVAAVLDLFTLSQSGD